MISQSETDLLDILVKSHQLNLPEKVKWRGKEVNLSSKEQLAAGRTIWFIIKRGYGISTATSGSYHVAHQGYVGVMTYMDMHGNLRVKSEVLVATSGIETGANGIAYPTDE